MKITLSFCYIKQQLSKLQWKAIFASTYCKCSCIACTPWGAERWELFQCKIAYQASQVKPKRGWGACKLLLLVLKSWCHWCKHAPMLKCRTKEKLHTNIPLTNIVHRMAHSHICNTHPKVFVWFRCTNNDPMDKGELVHDNTHTQTQSAFWIIQLCCRSYGQLVNAWEERWEVLNGVINNRCWCRIEKKASLYSFFLRESGILSECAGMVDCPHFLKYHYLIVGQVLRHKYIRISSSIGPVFQQTVWL